MSVRDVMWAWLDGDTVQYCYKTNKTFSEWQDYDESDFAMSPAVMSKRHFKWRIKPKLAYRLALVESESKKNVVAVNDPGSAKWMESSPMFIRWLTPYWNSVET